MPCWCPRARMVYPLSCPSVVGLLLFCDDLDLNAVSKETFVSFPTSPRPDVSTGYPGGSVLLYPAVSSRLSTTNSVARRCSVRCRRFGSEHRHDVGPPRGERPGDGEAPLVDPLGECAQGLVIVRVGDPADGGEPGSRFVV